MSYNCYCQYISGKLFINIADRHHLLNLGTGENSLPESNFLDPYMEKYCINYTDDPSILEVKAFCWSGDGSGYTMEYLMKTILPKTMGEAEILVIWERGDSVTGIHVKDGIAKEKKVTYTLVD